MVVTENPLRSSHAAEVKDFESRATRSFILENTGEEAGKDEPLASAFNKSLNLPAKNKFIAFNIQNELSSDDSGATTSASDVDAPHILNLCHLFGVSFTRDETGASSSPAISRKCCSWPLAHTIYHGFENSV